MTWFAPRPTLKVALEHGRFTGEPGALDWTDLSDRIIDPWIVDLCSRDSARDDFRPGQLTVTLDNSDRALDPTNASGLVYAASGYGLPGCPVTFDLTYDGTTERRFTGYLTGGWEGAGTPRVAGDPRPATVTLTAMDRLAWSGDLPNSAWACATKALWPDWWLPMDPPNAVIGDGQEVPDRSGTTSSGAVLSTSPGGLARPDGAEVGGWVPWLKVPPDAYLTSEAADIMPDGDETDLTCWCWWTTKTEHSPGEESVVMRMVYPGGGNTRWEIVVDEDGIAQVATYDAGGTLIDSDSISPTFLSRWDNTGQHLVVARFDGGTMDVWFGGDTATLTATSDVYESDLICGPSDVICWWDEVTLWRRALADVEIASVLLAAGGYLGQWFGQAYTDRLGSWLEAAGIAVTVDWTDRWRVPIDDTDVSGFVSLGAAGLPGDLATAYRRTVGSGPQGGAVTCDRDGFLVARDVTALTAGTWDDTYATAAKFSDAVTLGSGVMRHAGVVRSSGDEDGVINRVEGQFWYITDLGPPMALHQLPFSPESTTTVGGRLSREQYGTRTLSFTSERYGWEETGARCQAILDRCAWPAVEGFDVLAIDATALDDETAWLMTVEAEQALEVTYTPHGGSATTVGDLHLQGLRIVGTTTTLTAQGRAFRS